MFWIFWFITMICICVGIVKANKDKIKSAILGCIIVVFLCSSIPAFLFIGNKMGSILLSFTGVFIFVGFIILGAVFTAISTRKIVKKLNDYEDNYYKGEVVDTILSYSSYTRNFKGEVKVRTKHRIVFKYIDENGEEKRCTTHEMYDVFEMDEIEKHDKKIDIAVVKSTCKIYDSALLKKLEEVKARNDALDI